MHDHIQNALSEGLSKHIKLSKTRTQTLSWLILLIVQYGTISFWRLAAHVSTAADINSTRRRFYRFFQYVTFDAAISARLIMEMFDLLKTPLILAIDRTNWKLGKKDIDILMISVLWNGSSVPLIWTLLSAERTSAMSTRIALLERFFEIFPNVKITTLVGDREFIGNEWIAYLKQRNIPFIIRVRESIYLTRPGRFPQLISQLARDLGVGETLALRGPCHLGKSTRAEMVYIVIKRLSRYDLLTLAYSDKTQAALKNYRLRWTIETMFSQLKTRGFNLEDTHIVNPQKLETLLGILAIASALAIKVGVTAETEKEIPLKKHGRKAYSSFAYGLYILHKIFAIEPAKKLLILLKTLLYEKIKPNSLIFKYI